MDNGQRVGELEHSAWNGMSLSNPSPQGSGISARSRETNYKNQRWWMSPRKHCLLDTRLINIWLIKSVTLYPTLTRKLCTSDARWRAKINRLLQMKDSGCVKHPPGQGLMSHSSWPTQHGLHGSSALFVWYFCLNVFFWFGGCFVEGRDRMWPWTGREVGRGKNMIKINYIKQF